MNILSITFILGWILRIEAGFMLLPIATSLLYGERQGWAFVLVLLICLAASLLLTRKKPEKLVFYAREGFVTTALSWIVRSVFGALPFRITGEIPRFVDALFETVSGFTTTGSSILVDVEALSHCSLIWRSFTHWIGGMGVLVFLLAVLPLVGGSNMYLMLYMMLTALQIVLMLLGGMPVFDAVCTAFGTAGTGGFGIRNSSIAGYSPYLQWVITVFMIVFGVNFNVYFLLFMRRAREALHCEELRCYLTIIAAAVLVICINTYDMALTFEHNVRNSAFQVASIITTTGFATVDFDLWPQLARSILIILMFCGACAGSTGGGLKVSRFVIGAKALGAYIGSFLHPRSVRRIRFEQKDVEKETVHAVLIYFVAVVLILVISVLLVSLDNHDLVSTFTAVAATFNNIGPGLHVVGPTCNYSVFSDLAKCVLIFDMLAGRLEIFPMLLLLYPPLWKETVSMMQNRKRMRS